MQWTEALAYVVVMLGLLAALLAIWVARLRHALKAARFAGRSQATRYGQITEQFAPFMPDWPWDSKGFRFIGSPIDGVQFTADGVILVEIKSAGGRLTPEQRAVREHVEAGRVTWHEVRVG